MILINYRETQRLKVINELSCIDIEFLEANKSNDHQNEESADDDDSLTQHLF
jgi:hypothetical protein